MDLGEFWIGVQRVQMSLYGGKTLGECVGRVCGEGVEGM